MSLGATTKCTRDIKGCSYCHIPLALFPIPMPASLYRDALIKEEAMGVLYAMLCSKPSIIHKTLEPCLSSDLFIQRLVKVSQAFNDPTRKSPKQNVHMCIFRTDFMIDMFSGKLKIIEFNTIATGCGSLWQRITEI